MDFYVELNEQKKIIKNCINITCDSFNDQTSASYNSDGKLNIDTFLELAGNTRLGYGLQLLLISAFFKHPKFKEENELRFIFYQKNDNQKTVFFREGTSTVIPYIEIDLVMESKDPLPIKELIIGPTPNQDLSIKMAKKVLSHYGIESCTVVPSEIPYRTW